MGNNRVTLLGSLKLYGLPWQLFFGAFVIVILAAYKGVLTTDMAGTMALCIAMGGVLDEIGERLPIWNSYIGGGILMAFFGTAVLKQFGIIPQKYLDSIDWFVSGDVGFLTFFIVFLITGSILSLDRKILLKSFAGYIPAILGGIAASMLFGVGTAWLFGINPTEAITKFVLPIMGGGTRRRRCPSLADLRTGHRRAESDLLRLRHYHFDHCQRHVHYRRCPAEQTGRQATIADW